MGTCVEFRDNPGLPPFPAGSELQRAEKPSSGLLVPAIWVFGKVIPWLVSLAVTAEKAEP